MLKLGVTQQVSQVFHAPWWKSCAACVGVVVTEHFGINHIVLYLYMGLLTLDLMAGTVKSIVWGQFQTRKIYWWFLKFGTHMGLFFLFGVLYLMTRLVTGLDIPSIVNYIILMLSFTEVISILNNGIKMGLPVNPIIIRMVKKMRYKAYRNLMSHFETDEVESDIQDALTDLDSNRSCGCRRDGLTPDTGDRRRATDAVPRTREPYDQETYEPPNRGDCI